MYHKVDFILFLFNGPDLEFPDEDELKQWYYENGLKEEVIHSSDYYDKGYAFFRYCMDSDIKHEDTVKLVKYCIRK